MVPHLKGAHENQEIFESRFSPKMVEMIRVCPNPTVLNTTNRGKYMTAMFLFCGESEDFSVQYWIHHIRNHTGEYANSRDKDVCFQQHCGFTTEPIEAEIFDLKTADLTAFICCDCNFVQIKKENIWKHFKNEHGLDDVRNRYEEIVLLTAWDNHRIASNHKIVPGKIRKFH